MKAVQGMLDFDFVCSRKKPSVAAMVYPFRFDVALWSTHDYPNISTNSADHKQKFYWGHKEIFIPVYSKMNDAMTRHSDADVMISFASLRSAEESTIEALQYNQIRTIAIIAEGQNWFIFCWIFKLVSLTGIPENTTRKLNKLAQEKNVVIVGPATVS